MERVSLSLCSAVLDFLDAVLAINKSPKLPSCTETRYFLLIASISIVLLSILMPFRWYRIYVSRSTPVFVLGIVSVASSVAVSEVILRLVLPQKPSLHLREAGRNFVFHPDTMIIAGLRGVVRHTINSIGIRGSELPVDNDTYRILFWRFKYRGIASR